MSWKHISGWVQVTNPEGPEAPIDPGYGTEPPVDPGYGHGDWAPARPGHDLPGGGGHIWGALIRWAQRPHIDNDPSRPPGRPVQPLPPSSPGHPGNRPPNSGRPPHAGWPGHWEPVDPGFGRPPLWAFIPAIDNGLPAPPEVTPAPPGGGTKPPGGAWFPLDPDYGKPIRPCPPAGGKPHPPLWGWVPDRPEVEPPDGGGTTTTTFYPSATVTVLASGGSGSINVTVAPEGPWTVLASSVPDWVTITPMSGDMSTNVTYSASVNTTGLPKQALIKVNEATLTINQGAV